MNLNENYTGKTKLKDWWIIVRDNFKAIATRFNSHATATALDHPEGCVCKKHMATNSVGTSQVESKAITEDKIALSAVTTDKVKDGNITRIKLHADVQSELDSFQEHIDNPSQEIADGAVTMDKLNEDVKSEIGKINDAYLVSDPIDLESKGLNYDENLGEAYLSSYAPDSNALYIIKDAKGSAMYINDPDGVIFECVTLAGGNSRVDMGDTVIIKFVYPDSEGEFGKFYILSRASSGGSSITVDSELSDTSTNPVQNKVVKAEIDKKAEHKTLSEANFNEVVEPGIYVMDCAADNTPDGAPTLSGCYTLIVGNSTSDSADYVHQIAIPEITTDIYVRFKNGSSGWSEWEQLPKNLQYTHTTTRTQIGTWIDGAPIWRVSFDEDYTFSADVKNEEGYYYPLNNVMNVKDMNDAAILDYNVFARVGAPCLIDDVEGQKSMSEYIYFSVLNESSHNGVYGYVDFITAADNFA